MIRQEIEILSADDPKQLKLGWTVKETIGRAIINPRALKGFKRINRPTHEQVTIDGRDNIISD